MIRSTELPKLLALARAIAAFVAIGDTAHARPLVNEFVAALEAAEGPSAEVHTLQTPRTLGKR